MVQGRVGQHESQKFRVRGKPRRKARILSRLGQDNGPLPAFEQTFLDCGEVAQDAGRFQVADHDGQGLVFSVLAGAQFVHGRLVAGVADEVETAQTLHGHKPAGQEQVDRVHDCVVVCSHRRALPVRQPEPWAADRAGVGLGVEAPVEGVFVFFTAVRAERKTAHGRAGPVVGNGAGDGVTRAAVGAVGEGVPVAAIVGITHVRDAVGAGGHIRADQHLMALAAGAFENFKGAFAGPGRCCFPFPGHDAGQGREGGFKGLFEGPQLLRASLDLNEHALGRVGNLPRDLGVEGGLIDKGTKADALHPSGDDPFPALHEHV